MTTRREFLQTIPAAGAAFSVAGLLLEGCQPRVVPTPPLEGHFHPKGKAPSEFTREILSGAQPLRGRAAQPDRRVVTA